MNSLLIYLAEKPSFEGELEVYVSSIDGNEETYKLHCYKSPPSFAMVFHPKFDEKRGRLCWERSLARVDVERLIHLLESREILHTPEEIWGLDGTTYELGFLRGSHKIRLEWWCKLPRAWSFLEEVVDTLLQAADQRSILKECEVYSKQAEAKRNSKL